MYLKQKYVITAVKKAFLLRLVFCIHNGCKYEK